MSRERILVTGGCGYIGSILCEHLLDAGYAVTVLDSLIFGQKPHFHLCADPNYDFVFGDVRDKELVSRLVSQADIIIPLAALVGAPLCDQDPWLAKSVNFEAIKLINSLRSQDQFLVYPMTNSGYGTHSGEEFCTEETPLEPISLYGITKVDGEKEVLGKGNAVSLRLATVFGLSPRMRVDLLVNFFTYKAVKEKALVLFEKDFKRNFVHVRDVADCMIHCIRHRNEMKGLPYNVGLDSANMSKEELALKIKEYVPDLYIHYAEIGTDPDKRNYIVSNQRLREAGFEARRSIDDGIKELIKGYRMLRRGELTNI
ncbi:MAG: NAD(P)-dependent oxidoreductase [Candidatus Dadabacteria bacterium]|nr:MAG: NAD(P)-dependent oxidoreductase [Candidatus Dadabacteria bacterium]